MFRSVSVLVLAMVAMMSFGCKKYEVPEYKEVQPNQTAFVIELEGDDQSRLNSIEDYEAKKVSNKRIRITKRWNQTGRLWYSGDWIPTVSVITVDRSPVTREWTSEEGSGTSSKDEAIWVESSDSVGFSVGFNCTAYIEEPNASTFLYYYPSGSLASVMDTEIRSRIQQIAAEQAAKEPMDTLREKKNQIIAAIREDVIPFFRERGITITTIGMFGGFTYENNKIQESIDLVFVAQQEKNREQALLEAMDSKTKRLEQEGIAEANQAREVAKGKADGVVLIAKAEAESIRLINIAAAEAANNPLLLQLKQLEVEQARISKWNGNVPSFMMGESGGGFLPLMQMTVPETK